MIIIEYIFLYKYKTVIKHLASTEDDDPGQSADDGPTAESHVGSDAVSHSLGQPLLSHHLRPHILPRFLRAQHHQRHTYSKAAIHDTPGAQTRQP